MISQREFFGSGVFRAISAATTLNPREARCYTIKATGAQNVNLPDARTLPEGGPLLIVFCFPGGGALQIKSNTGTNVGGPITAGQIFELYLADNTTQNGTWIGRARTISTGSGVIPHRRFFISSGTTLSIWSPFPSNTWAAGTAVASAHREAGAFALGRSLFIVGDFPISGTSLTNSEYSTVTTAWTTRAAAPFQVCQPAAASSYRRDVGEIYGGSGTGATKTMRFTRWGTTTGAGSWSGMSALPIAKTRCSAAMIEGLERVIVTGGEPEPTPNLARNVATDTWWTIANHLSPFRHSMASFVINGRFYMAGGRTEIVPITRFQQLDEYDPATDTWTARAALSLGARWSGAGVGANGAGFYVSGFDNADVASIACVRYQLDTWAAIASINAARTGIVSHGASIQ